MNLHIVDDLRRALEADEIVPYFQPVVELSTCRLAGFEVLARWNHPTLGLVSPDSFIPVAEEAGMIGSLTERVMLESFEAAKILPETLALSVNISAIQLRDHSLVRLVASAAERGGFSLSRLTIELTESALIGNLARARPIAEELKGMGARLAIDDFGTGYSSLKHLHALPFDEIKVDASFVRSMVNDRESRKIVAAVVGLGQSLGLITAAEGIEHKEQAEMLLFLGCGLAQGWLYGRPVPAAELPAVLASSALSKAHEFPISALHPNHTLGLVALPGHRLAQLQAIYDGAPVGLCYLDRNLRYVSINKRLAEMNGLPVHAHLGRRMAEVVPQTYLLVTQYLQRALNGEAIPSFEVSRTVPSMPDPDRTLLVSYHPARDETDEVVGISVSVVDITEHKRSECARIEMEDHYRNAVELSPQVPWTADADGMIVEHGPRWEVLTGMTSEETVNLGWRKAVHPDDLGRAIESAAASLRSGQPMDLEYRIRQRDGEWRWMRSRAAPRRGPNGEIIRWYGTLEDIDHHKCLAEELQRSQARIRELEKALEDGHFSEPIQS